MTRRILLLGALAAGGFSVYIWPALRAPVVVWSDSTIDLQWARAGAGILSPATARNHPAKPGYLLWLRAAMAMGPAQSETRRIVVLQSVLLWLAIGLVALRVARRLGAPWGIALYVILVLLLCVRDSASSIMPEALTAAFLLVIAAILLEPPARRWTCLLLGAGVAALFLVRPNAGGAALALAIASLLFVGRGRAILPMTIGFATLLLPFWILTTPLRIRFGACPMRSS